MLASYPSSPVRALGRPQLEENLDGADQEVVPISRAKRPAVTKQPKDYTDEEIAARLGGFKPTGEMVGTAGDRAAARLKIDTFGAWDVRRGTPYFGVALVLHEFNRGHIRVTAQAANDRLGVGVGWRIVPVIDLTSGVGAFYDFAEAHWSPCIFLARYSW